MSLKEAINEIKKGRFILIHDFSDRENETDMVIKAEKTKPQHVVQMRQNAGGLICVAIHPEVAKKIKLPYMTEIYEKAYSEIEILNSAEANDIPYDERSAFSITVNHRDTFTGITDGDRALTIRELGRLSREILNGENKVEFGRRFRTPGHVPLLRAAESLLAEREGHTEFSVSLTEMAGEPSSTVVCEMLDPETERALSDEKAKKFAREKGLVYIEGEEIKEAFSEWGKERN